MATFYGTMKAEGKKYNTKIGRSHITSHTRGWDHGIEVTYRVHGKTGAVCEVWQTGGSNNPERKKLIKTIKLKDISKRRPGSMYYGHAFGGAEVKS
jgi:hypothetical protein